VMVVLQQDWNQRKEHHDNNIRVVNTTPMGSGSTTVEQLESESDQYLRQ
jgi:hypothetical protein